MKIYFYVVSLLLFVYIFTIPDTEEHKISNSSLKKQSMAKVFSQNEVINLPVEEYVIGVVACEMPASFNIEALKAGAVAARTFYFYKNKDFDYVASDNDQCYISKEQMKSKWGEDYEKYYNKIKNAVVETAEEYITYNGEIIQSFYFSMSNGLTEDATVVFDESKPYLVSVSSVWEKNLANYQKEVIFSKQDFANKLSIDVENLEIEILSKTSSGRVNLIKINDSIFNGIDLRKKLGLRSTDFNIYLNEEKVIITTKGYGHGVGLSQYGANEMAKLGYSYTEILKHYYSGVEIFSV